MIKWEQHEVEAVPIAVLAGEDTNRLKLLELLNGISKEKHVEHHPMFLYDRNDHLIADSITLDFIDNSDEYCLSLYDNSMILIKLHCSEELSSKSLSKLTKKSTFSENNNNYTNKKLSITSSNTTHHLYSKKSRKSDKNMMKLYIDSSTSDDVSGIGSSSNSSGDDSGSESSGSLHHNLSIRDRQREREREREISPSSLLKRKSLETKKKRKLSES